MNPSVHGFSKNLHLLRFSILLTLSWGLNQTNSFAQLYNYTNASSGAPAFVAGNITASNLALGGGVAPAIPACGINQGFGAEGWPTTNTFNTATFNTAGDYIGFTMAPQGDFGLKITGLSARLRRENQTGTANDGPLAVRYAYRIGPSGAWTPGVNPGNPQSSNLCASSGVVRTWPTFGTAFVGTGDTIYFRIYGLSSGSSLTGDLYLHDVVVSGEVCDGTPTIELDDIPAICFDANGAGSAELAFQNAHVGDQVTVNFTDTQISDLPLTALMSETGSFSFAVAAGTPAGEYEGTLTLSNSCGFEETYLVVVTVNPLPVVTCPPNFSVCVDADSVELSDGSPGGGTYSGAGVDAGIFTPSDAGAGNHNITYSYTDGNGCENSCSFVITVNALSATVDAGPDQSTCDGGILIFGGSVTGSVTTGTWTSSLPGGMFSPNNTEIADHYTPPGGNPASLTLTLTSGGVCPASDDLVVTYGVTPDPLTLAVTGPSSATCGEDVVFQIITTNGFNDLHSLQYSVNWDETQLMYVSSTGTMIGGAGPGIGETNIATGEAAYFWFDVAGILGEDLPTGSVLWTINFKVINNAGITNIEITDVPTMAEAENKEYCLVDIIGNSAAISLQPISVTCPSNLTVCLNDNPVTLTGEMPAGGTYSGSGVTGNVFDPETAGVGMHPITYIYTDANSCTNSCTLSVQVNPLPDPSFTVSDDEICPGSSIDLTFLEGFFPVGTTFTLTADLTDDNNTATPIGPYSGITSGTVVNLTEGVDFNGSVTLSNLVVTETVSGCSNTADDVQVDVLPHPVFEFTATVNGRDPQTGSNANGPTTITLDFCEGEYFCFSDYAGNASNIGILEEITGGTQNVYYGATHIDVPRVPTPLSAGTVPTYFSTCPPGGYGPYLIDPGTSGQIIQVYTPYLDANNNGSYDPGIDCPGDAITLIYNIYAAPAGSADPQTICSGETTGVGLNSDITGTTFEWVVESADATVDGEDAGSGTMIVQTLTGYGQVTYSVTPIGPAPNNCAGAPFEVTVTVNPPVEVSIIVDENDDNIGDDNLICAGDAITLIFDETGAYPDGTAFTITALVSDDNVTDAPITYNNVVDGDELVLVEGVDFTGTLTVNNIQITLDDVTACAGTVQGFTIIVNPQFAATIDGPTCVHSEAEVQLTGSDDIALPATFVSGTWSSSDEDLATVDNTGLVTGVMPGGPVTISYTVTDNAGCVHTATHVVTVLGPITLTTTTMDSPVGCGDLAKMTVTVDNFCDITSLVFSAQWDETKFVFDHFDPSVLTGADVATPGATGDLDFTWFGDPATLIDGATVLCYYLKATGNTGSGDVSTSDGGASNSLYSLVTVENADPLTIVIQPLSLVLGNTPPICPNETSTTLTYCGVVGNPTEFNIYFDAAAQLAGFPPSEGGTLTPDVDGCGNIIITTIPTGLPHGSYGASIVIFNEDTGCESIPFLFELVVDDEPPVVTISPETVEVSCPGNVPAPNIQVVTATDNCPGTLTIVHEDDESDAGTGCCGDPLTIIRTYRVTDASGLSANVTQTITVEDCEAPVILPGFALNSCYADEAALEAFVDANIGQYLSDNCSQPTADVYISEGESGCEYEVTIFIADACHNAAAQPYVFTTVIDNTPPVVVAGLIDDCYETLSDDDPLTEDAVQAAIQATMEGSSDGCSQLTYTTAVTPLNDHCMYQIVVTATDGCGYAGTVTYVTRVDNTPPEILTDDPSSALEGNCYQTEEEAENAAIALTQYFDNCSEPSEIILTAHMDYLPDTDCDAIVVVEVTDYCGNVTYVEYPGVRIDDVDPVIPVPESEEDSELIPTISCFQTSEEAEAYMEDFVRSIVNDCTPSDELEVTGVYTLIEDAFCESGIVTVTVTDCAGNSSSEAYPVDIDAVSPDFDELPVLEVVCIDAIPPAEDFYDDILESPVYATDACGNLTVELLEEVLPGPGDCGLENAGYRIYQVTDCAGNTAVQTQVIVLNDNESPTWENDITSSLLGCSCEMTQCIADLLAFTPNVVDNGCLSIVPTIVSETDETVGCLRTITRVWTAADDCGNQIATNFTQTILIQDEEAPTFNPGCQFMPPLLLFTAADAVCPGEATISLSVGQVISTADTWSVAGISIPSLAGCVADNCTSESGIQIKVVSIEVNDDVYLLSCARMITIAFEISDACGNVNETNFVCQYIVVDNVAPTWVTEEGDLNYTLQCSDAAGLAIVQNLNPVAQDACDEAVTVEQTLTGGFIQGNCPQAGTYTNMWTATDCSGNVSTTFVQVITIIDTQAPTWVTSPGALNTTVSCNNMGQLADAQALAPQAQDCDLSLTPVKSAGMLVPGNCPGTGTITNTWTVTDDCGNTSTVYTQVITVIDNTPPTATAGSISTCYPTALAAQTAAIAATMANDECSTVTKTAVTTGTCAATIVVTVTDCSGNTATVSYATRIDNTGPTLVKGTINLCYPTLVDAEAAAKAATTRTDNCPGGLSITASTTGTCPAAITVTVTDGCGNSSSVVYNNVCIGVASVDITVPASNMSVNCANETSALNAWLANHGGAVATGNGVAWTYSPMPIVFGPPSCTTHTKSVVVTFTASDDCGASETTTATFTVEDLTPPTVNPIPNTSYTCVPGNGIPAPDVNLVTGEADNCGGAVTVALFSNSTSGTGCPASPMVILRTYAVTDQYCNTTYVTHTITIVDNVPPTFTPPANITVNVDANCNYNALPAATGDVTNEADNCATGLNATYTDAIVPGFDSNIKYIITRTWTLTDNCGNNAVSATQVISVRDAISPTISCPNAVSVPGGMIENNQCAWQATNLTPVFSDNCPGVTLTYSLSGFFTGSATGSGPVNGRTFLEGETTVTYTVTDAVGNTAVCSFVISVNCTTVSGRIIWEHDDATGVKDATVRLSQGMTILGSTLSNLNGNYSLAVNLPGAYAITPVKNINRMNGVTAADATAIQQHIDGTNVITDPYKKVAADVNHTGFITTQDATLITQSLANNPIALAAFNIFWRFTPTTYVMPVTPPSMAPAFPENITVNVVGPDITGQDFFGMKIGDVNGSAMPASAPEGTPLVWMLKDQLLQAGAEIELNFAASGFTDLAAMQFALDFDPSYLQFAGFQSLDAIAMTADNFGDFHANLGELRVVWAQAKGLTLADGTPVLKAKFKVLQGGQKLSEVLQLDHSAMLCQAYTETLVPSDVKVVFVESVSAKDPLGYGKPQLQLFQNQPNPFAGETTIGFVLPEGCEAQLRIMDVSGRELTNYKRTYTAGYHEIEFRMENAASYGVLYYELITPFGHLTKKMITSGK